MKRLVEDFDDMMNIEDEVSVEDTKSPLEKELIRVYEYLKDKGETDIKAYEVAYQEAIENIYPENSWWEVIDLNIFWDLFENQNPRTTIDNIISSVKPEFKKEVIDTVVTEDVEEENPLKDIRSNIIEFPNGEYAYVEYADGKLYAGSATNRGIIHEYEMDYDKDFDVDRNLQNFFDKIIEENPELGEPLDESKKVCEDTVKQGNKWVNKGKDGTHGTFRTKKAADAQRKAMFANKGKKSTFGEGLRKDISLFEPQHSVSFEQIEPYTDFDEIISLMDNVYIDGGKRFDSKNTDFLDKKVDNEAIHRAFGEMSAGLSDEDRYQFIDVGDIFAFFDKDSDIVKALSAGLGENYVAGILRGRSASDVAYIYYSKDQYPRLNIENLGDRYFGKVSAWYNPRYGRFTYTDSKTENGDLRKIAQLISHDAGIPVDKIELYPTDEHRQSKSVGVVDERLSRSSTFGESFKVGDTFTNAGEEWEILRSKGDYSLVYAKDRKFYPYVVAYRLDDDGTWAQGHYFSNKDSAEKFLTNETGSVNESKQRRRSNRCVMEAKQEKLSKKTKAKGIYESMKRKPKKNLKEAADDEIKLFMNTWANYNENGADDGITPTGWMSLDEAEEYAEKYAEYEPFINDTENVPKELGVGEYSNIPETVDMLRKYEDFDDTQREVFAAFIDDGYEVDEAFDIVDDGDYFYIEGDGDTDLAYNYIDETGGIEELGRDTLEQYFDYDAFGRDLAFDFIKTKNGYVSR